jgi:hypothetical protein
MSCITRPLLPIALLLVSVVSLPAPISEETAPTPKPQPKQETTPKPKPKPAATPKPKPTPNRSFVGNWTGSAVWSSSNGESGTTVYLIKISDDEKTAWVNWGESETNLSGPGYQAPCNRFREALTWSLTFAEYIVTDTLRMNANGTATFVREGRWTSGDNQGITFNHSGTLSRQDSLPAGSITQTTTASAPQTATTPATSQDTALPIAKPVLERPGFVYNPFDRNAKRLLDVRGRASGSKVKDPFSEKLFIVP